MPFFQLRSTMVSSVPSIATAAATGRGSRIMELLDHTRAAAIYSGIIKTAFIPANTRALLPRPPSRIAANETKMGAISLEIRSMRLMEAFST